MSDIIKQKKLATQEDCSKGGKTRAKNLSPERRRQIAIDASHSRKPLKNLPKATHFGKINIADNEIICAVLENRESVITETSLFKLFGINRGGRKKVGEANMPRFLSSNNLQKYLSDDLRGGAESFRIMLPKGGMAYAFKAETVPKILKVYLDARREGSLRASQEPLAMTAEIILTALSQTGIISLIHEVTGYQEFRDKNELQNLFSKFIAVELQPWVKRFPDEFFIHLKRMYGLQGMKKNPRFFGHLVNRYVYGEISGEVLEELKRKNPLEEGTRKARHHQFLTDDVGCPALHKQLVKVTTLMSVSDSKEEFEKLLEKSRN
jgi:hypothetical protein